MDDFAFLTTDQRRDVLLALASTPAATLAAIGLEPAGAPLYVMSNEGVLDAGTHLHCLMAAVASLGMNVLEPIEVQGQQDSPDTFEVWADVCDVPTRLASAATREQAMAILQANLEMLAGHTTLAFADWLAVQSSDPFTETPSTRRAAQWAHLVDLEVVGRAHGDGWTTWDLDLPPDATKVRHKHAREHLMEAGTLRRLKQGKTVRRYQLRAVELDGFLYANFHDLSRAARNGVDVSSIRPWPYFDANEFVICREYQRYLRAHGWRMLWSDEPPPTRGGTRIAAGATWVRAESPPVATEVV